MNWAVVRSLLIALWLISGVAPLSGVTLQQLSMDDLAVQSTAIVRGHVMDSYTAVTGQTVYTHYRVTVSEVLKGQPGMTVDVALPGGTAAGVRQSFPGVPQLSTGGDYVIYLWTSPSGITMPTGFSQGIFQVSGDTAGLQISRSATAELMLDAKGHTVRDQAITMRLTEMRSRVATSLAGHAGNSK